MRLNQAPFAPRALTNKVKRKALSYRLVYLLSSRDADFARAACCMTTKQGASRVYGLIKRKQAQSLFSKNWEQIPPRAILIALGLIPNSGHGPIPLGLAYNGVGSVSYQEGSLLPAITQFLKGNVQPALAQAARSPP